MRFLSLIETLRAKAIGGTGAAQIMSTRGRQRPSPISWDVRHIRQGGHQKPKQPVNTINIETCVCVVIVSWTKEWENFTMQSKKIKSFLEEFQALLHSQMY